jgi:hypothetical protein
MIGYLKCRAPSPISPARSASSNPTCSKPFSIGVWIGLFFTNPRKTLPHISLPQPETIRQEIAKSANGRDDLRLPPFADVCVTPPDHDLSFARGILELRPRAKTTSALRTIDTLFESLAADRSERAIDVDMLRCRETDYRQEMSFFFSFDCGGSVFSHRVRARRLRRRKSQKMRSRSASSGCPAARDPNKDGDGVVALIEPRSIHLPAGMPKPTLATSPTDAPENSSL